MFTVESYRFARESDKARELLRRRFAHEDGTIVIDEFSSLAFEYFLDVLYDECVYLYKLPLFDHNSCPPQCRGIFWLLSMAGCP
jgi:hypothetical protein